MTSEVSAHDPLIGQALGHYRIIEKIGAGGMGVVYRARDEHLDREVAIKVLPERAVLDEHARKLLHKEAVALSKLNHPHIAAIYDFDTQQGLDFLVMEYVSGETLSRRTAASAPSEKEVATVGLQIAQALEEAHEHGIIHRDLKPANIAISAKGLVKVLDFGLAKFFDPARGGLKAETLTQSVDDSHLLGTLPYMAPEQVGGEHIDARTDIYGLGVVLYEMTTQKRPFREESTPRLFDSILHQSVVAPRVLNPRLSPELERIILKCLEKEPENRYQSAKELAIDLRRLVAPVTATEPVSRRKFGLTTRISFVGASVVGLILATWALHPWELRDKILGRASSTPIRSVVVLPFTNLSGDPQQEYFADGMTEELTSDLTKIGALRVISRTSAMRYKGTNKSSPEISRELNVDGIIEGSVQRSGSRVRITAQLIHAPSDTHKWADSYERDLGDILALQDEVARAIAREIKVTVTPEEQLRLTRAHQVDSQSYELYLKGRYFWNKRTPEGLKKSLEYFQLATDKDPTNALASAGLADTYALLGSAGEYGEMPPKDAMPKAEAAAKQALQLDATLAEAHVTLGYVRWIHDWDWQDAEREYQQAIKLNPSYAHAHHWYAFLLVNIGRTSDAISEIRKAQGLDPLSLIISTDVGEILYSARQYDEAIEQLKTATELDPNFATAHFSLARCYTHKKMYPEAISEMKRAIELGDRPAWTEYLAYAYAMAGHRNEAIGVLNSLNEQSKHRFIPSSNLTFVHIALGDTDRAFYFLEKAYAEHESIVAELPTDPDLDPLRSDARFQDLLRRVNLPSQIM